MVKSAADIMDDRASKTISDAQVNAMLTATYMQHLHIILPIVTAFFVVLLGFHILYSPETVSGRLALIAGLTGLVSLVLYSALKLGKIRGSFSHYTMVPIGLMTIFLVFTNIFYTQDILQLNKSLLLMVCIALMIMRRMIFWVLMAVIAGLYILALFKLEGNTSHHAFVGAGIFAVSIGLFLSRMHAIRQQVRLSLLNAEKDKALSGDKTSRDRFLGTMSYELRTPLTGVMGMLDLLKNSELDRSQTEYVSVARKSAGLLQNIINDILDMARLKSGELQLVNQVFGPEQVADSVIRILNAEAAQKGISISFAVEGDMPDAVMGDYARISQVLMNLLENAVKYTEKGGIDLLLTSQRNGDNVDLMWSVQDTGPGFDEKNIDKIFNRYDNMATYAKADNEGSGLGLAIARDLIDLMGGEIGASSVVGEGSNFWFKLTLPMAESTEVIDHGDVVSSPVFDKPLTILVAEDNPINQMLIVKLLEKGQRWRVHKAVNGQEAVTKVQHNVFDFVLMDIQMPVMDGIEATKQIRALGDRHAKTPIIALTANAMAEDVSTYMEAGMTDFIAKPINADIFYKAIAKAVQA